MLIKLVRLISFNDFSTSNLFGELLLDLDLLLLLNILSFSFIDIIRFYKDLGGDSLLYTFWLIFFSLDLYILGCS